MQGIYAPPQVLPKVVDQSLSAVVCFDHTETGPNRGLMILRIRCNSRDRDIEFPTFL